MRQSTQHWRLMSLRVALAQFLNFPGRHPLSTIAIVALWPSGFLMVFIAISAALITSAIPPLGLLALPLFLLDVNYWILACMLDPLLSFGMKSFHYTRNQHERSEELLSGLLAEDSKLRFSECTKELAPYAEYFDLKRLERTRKKIAPSWARELDSLSFDAPPFRGFVQRKDGNTHSSVLGTALAYPNVRGSSLIFLRRLPNQMSDDEKFTLYHELAHVTPLGIVALVRSNVWDALFPINLCLLTVLAMLTGQVAVMVPCIPQYYMMKLMAKLQNSAAELFADSVALTHPDFYDNWKALAERKRERLEDSLEDEEDVKKYNEISHQLSWLNAQIERNEVWPYHPVDNGLIALLTALIAGYAGHLLQGWQPSSLIFWVHFIFATGPLLFFAYHGREGYLMLGAVESALASKIGS